MEENIPLPAPTPTGNEEKFQEYGIYTCSKCSSDIEILSINNEQNCLTFKCLNNDIENNHKIQTMLIEEYIKDMEKYIYLYDECSKCHLIKNLRKNCLNIALFVNL